ncbi:MAG: hypothetical protein GY789_20670 [Hyphomicrobiales bacterium]|nr:hypothetical protein [Hyphomicrobiales bacterium]
MGGPTENSIGKIAMVGEVIAGLGAIKAVGETVKSLVNLRDLTKVNEIAIEMQKQIMEIQESVLLAQSEKAELTQKIGDLESRLKAVQDWEAEKQRYQLHDFGGGTYAYKLKQDRADGEPPHRICANCFNAGKKSVMQFLFNDNQNRDHFRCDQCNSETEFGQIVEPSDHSGNYDPLDEGW